MPSLGFLTSLTAPLSCSERGWGLQLSQFKGILPSYSSVYLSVCQVTKMLLKHCCARLSPSLQEALGTQQIKVCWQLISSSLASLAHWWQKQTPMICFYYLSFLCAGCLGITFLAAQQQMPPSALPEKNALTYRFYHNKMHLSWYFSFIQQLEVFKENKDFNNWPL